MDFYRVPGSLVYKDGASRLDSSIDFFRFIFATLLLKVEIEKLDCVLSKRATRPYIYILSFPG
jgi:hypothetical protein